MKKYIFLCLCVCVAWSVQAQELVPIPYDLNTPMVYNNSQFDFSLQIANKQIEAGDKEVAVRAITMCSFSNFTHINYTNNLGMIAGVGVRNIGIRARDELLGDVEYKRSVRRVYTLNASLAVKLGSFSKHCFVFAGGEYDLAFHFRQRLKTHSKSKIKQGEWWSTATDRFMPSLFVGVQFPKGLNLKCSYYLNDFFNENYSGKIKNFPAYTHSQMINIAISYQASLQSKHQRKQKSTQSQAVDM